MLSKRAIPSFFLALAIAAPAAAGQGDGPAGSPSLGELALRAGGSLVLVLLLFASLVFLLRRFRGGAAGLRDSANRFLRLRERIDLGARREIRVVEVQGRLLVVGVTNQGITLLTELDAAASPAEQAPPPAGGPLLRVLRKMNPGR
jgi:flagellar protein FliO/FliZ